jgi:DNA-binding MarR family transcriptional regulator
MTATDPRANEQLYIRFLKLVQAQKISPSGKELTPPEMHLLEDVALRHFESRPYTVSEALALHHLGSPATLHKRLKRLRDWGFLGYEQHPSDHRTKYLVATALTIAHFERMSDAMALALQG